jgi:hypothetical protein
VVNDDFEGALNELSAIVKSKRLTLERGKITHAKLIDQLLN